MFGGAWMAAAVAVALVLQFAAYWWLRKRASGADAGLFSVGNGAMSSESAAREGTCPSCGTENEPEYTFCRHCGGRISG